MQRIDYPPATQFVIDYLGPKYTGTPVSSRIPDAGNRFIKVLRGGGVADFISDRPILFVECYDLYEDDAERLAMDVRADLRALAGETIGDVWCYGVEEYAGPANLPDPRRPELSRYTFTLALKLRGSTHQ